MTEQEGTAQDGAGDPRPAEQEREPLTWEPEEPAPADGAQDGYLRVGDGATTPGRGGGWEKARSTCTACGAQGLLDEGWLEDTGESSRGYVRWVEGARDTGFFGGFSAMGASRILVRAFRCRECNHLELFAEPNR